MAMGLQFSCSVCDRSITAWSDGNPYFIDEDGQKQYAYHPDHERLARCVGNDTPHLCLECGHEFSVDSRAPQERCPTCSSSDLSATYCLEGKPCPCKGGTFDAQSFGVS